MDQKQTWKYTYMLHVDYSSCEVADMIVSSLEVDTELQAKKVSREMRADGCKVTCEFGSDEARLLRASVCTFLDLMAVATRVVEEFHQ